MPTSASDVMMAVDSLTAGYGSVTVIRDVSLKVRTGELVSVLGANGVGKTTLLRAIVGQARVTAGSITLRGKPIQGLAPHAITRMGIAVVPEGRALVPDLSVRDNLVLGTRVWNRRYASAAVSAAMDEVFDRFPILGRRRTQAAGSLSGGEQQMLAIGRALIARPTVLILDEPSLGLAPMLVRQVFDDLSRANSEGLTVLVVEQNASAALRVAARSYVMNGGRVVKEGEAAEIEQSTELHAAFLGHDNDEG